MQYVSSSPVETRMIAMSELLHLTARGHAPASNYMCVCVGVGVCTGVCRMLTTGADTISLTDVCVKAASVRGRG